MSLHPVVASHGRGLDFFNNSEAVCQQLRDHARKGAGESALRTLQCAICRDLDFVHNLPLQALNDRLKRYPFVDPHPFDDLLTDMLQSVLDWLQWVTKPYWISDACHRIGSLGAATTSGGGGGAASPGVADAGDVDNLALEQFGRFMYPMPLKLRELQAMVRPFMEVRSTHYIVGLDALVAELVRGLLRLFHTLKAWDDSLMEHVKRIAKAALLDNPTRRIEALVEACATMDMDSFEAAHRLSTIDQKVFTLPPNEIETICQRLPLFLDKRVLQGPPTAVLDHGGLPAESGSLDMEDDEEQWDGGDALGGVPVSVGIGRLKAARKEALTWWHDQGFMSAVPTRTLASTLLDYLRDHELQPDPFVTEMLPRVLERLFSVQVSCRAFMNKLLPRFGGYVDATGQEVLAGHGLPLRLDPRLCAESLLVFLRQWSDLVMGAEEEEAAARSSRVRRPKSGRRRGSECKLPEFLYDMQCHGHSNVEVVELLEGARPVPDHILNVPTEERRYCVDDGTRRAWELVTGQHSDLLEMLEPIHSDMGPYVHFDMDDPEDLARVWANQPKAESAWCLANPRLVEAAMKPYSMDTALDDDPGVAALLDEQVAASDSFALRLVESPAEGAASSTPSTFLRFFAGGRGLISRRGLQGLPQLPWSFGADPRNTVIVDVASTGIAAFHCVFSESRAQPHRVCVVPLGDPMSLSYIVCPKYQPIRVQNGDRLVCHQWTFELRVEPGGGEAHMSTLSILTDEGTVFKVPMDGCHVGAGNRSRHGTHQPTYPPTKFALVHRLRDMAAVHIAFHYHRAMNRWTMVDHSPDPLGTLLLLKQGVAYPLSDGLRVMIGPLVLEVVRDA